MSNKKSIFVTGCAGFIGSNFCKKFSDDFPEIDIVGIDNFFTGRKSALDKSVIFYEGSILDEDLLQTIFAKHKPEYVFHFAAVPRVAFSIERPKLTSEVNIVGTVVLLQTAKNHAVKRFIYSASSSVYGGVGKLPTKESENSPHPKSPYSIQKHAGELFCKTFSDLLGLDTVCLRYFNVFGPGQFGDSAYSSVISAWLEYLYLPSGNPPYLEGDGEQSRDFCYIDNVVQANILAMQAKQPLNGELINIAYGQQTSVNQAKSLIEEYTAKKIVLEKRPTRIGDVKYSLADISKARKLLGYDPKIDFRSGLKLTVEWFKSRETELEK